MIDRYASDHQDYVSQRSNICKRIKDIRRIIWCEFVETLSATTFTMSLPSYFKGLPGRAVEAHLAGSIIVFVNSKFSESFKNSLLRCEGLVFVDGELFRSSAMPSHTIGFTTNREFTRAQVYFTLSASSSRRQQLQWKTSCIKR